jgi:SAM-dependent methyltransferase
MADAAAIELGRLVAGLSEQYQPIHGHPEFAQRRPCADRLDAMVPVYLALREQLGRTPNVIDLGCAQGYFALSLAALGAEVTAVDREPSNIALCNWLHGEHPQWHVRFEQASIEDWLPRIGAGEFDLVLGLSVLHHLAFERGESFVRDALSTIVNGAGIAIVELARKEEDQYWSAALPDDPYELLAEMPFVVSLGTFPSHLADVRRPLALVSARWLWCGQALLRFSRWARQPHEFAHGFHGNSRRYFWADSLFAKCLRFEGPRADVNRREYEAEIRFLEAVKDRWSGAPALRGSAIHDGFGVLIIDRIPGTLLSSLMAGQEDYDVRSVLADLLRQLEDLEQLGYYHNDLRVWNILVDGARARLIDFGSIDDKPVDRGWPDDAFASFLLLAIEVAGKRVLPPDPVRPLLCLPANAAPEIATWYREVWSTDPRQWTFRWMRERFEARCLQSEGAADVGAARSDVTAALEWWLNIAERHARIMDHALWQERERLASRDSELVTVRRRLDVALEARASAEMSSATFEGELREARQVIARNEAEIRRLADDGAAAHRRLDAEFEARSRAEATAARLDLELREAWQTVAGRDVEIRRLGADAATAHRRLDAEYKARSRAEATTARLDLELQEVRQIIANRDAAIAAAEQTRRELEASLAAKQRLLHAETVAHASTSERLFAEREGHAATRAERDALRAERESLLELGARREAELAGVYASRSWRVTAPFRSTMGAIRAGKDAVRMPAAKILRRVARVVARALQRVRRWMIHHPRRHAWVIRVFSRMPTAKGRVKSFLEAHATEAGGGGGASDRQPFGPDSRTARVLADMDEARAKVVSASHSGRSSSTEAS